MKIKTLSIALAIMLSAIVICTLINIHIQKHKTTAPKLKIDNSYYKLRDNTIAGYYLKLYNLSNFYVLNVDGDSVLIEEIIKKQTKTLIVRFDDKSNCKICIESLNTELQRLQKDFYGCAENIVFIISVDSPREIYTYKRTFNIPFQTFGIKKGTSFLPHEDYGTNSIYYLGVISNGEIVSSFYPIKELDDINQAFFQYLKNWLIQKS